MEALTIEILNPKAKKLIMDLVDLKLISINKPNDKIADFKLLLNNLRSKSNSVPTLEEIADEVKIVRTERYEIKSK